MKHCADCGVELVRRMEGDRLEGIARWTRRNWCSSSCKRQLDKAYKTDKKIEKVAGEIRRDHMWATPAWAGYDETVRRTQ